MIYIFMHMDDESPGRIGEFLDRHGLPYRLLRAYAGDAVPDWDPGMRGLVFMGGVMSANDPLPWLAAELRLIDRALAEGTALLGHCLGGQLISKALGQAITRNPVREVGWHDCRRSQVAGDEVLAERWLGGIAEPFTMFHWHEETFALPPRARRLFSSEFCENQAYVYGDNVLAMQCHVEMTLPLVSRWIEEWRDDLQVSSASENDYAQISNNLAQRVGQLNEVADRLYSCWLRRLPMQTASL